MTPNDNYFISFEVICLRRQVIYLKYERTSFYAKIRINPTEWIEEIKSVETKIVFFLSTA